MHSEPQKNKPYSHIHRAPEIKCLGSTRMSSCVPKFQHATSWQQLGSLLERLQGAGWPLLLVLHTKTTIKTRIHMHTNVCMTCHTMFWQIADVCVNVIVHTLNRVKKSMTRIQCLQFRLKLNKIKNMFELIWINDMKWWECYRFATLMNKCGRVQFKV